jgi:type IV pilus assembly protein PilM
MLLMAVRVAGLDIGTFAVRAAELSLDGERPTLTAFGQVALPPGAVVGGEVIDIEAVTEAIRRLWASGRFSTKKVRLGVSSQRVIVRQADLPAMSAEDLRSAIHFEAQDLIPIPIEDALLDFCVLGTDAPDAEGDDAEPRMKVLLIAAQREMVMNHLACVQGAGLLVEAVDVVPLALFRAVPPFGKGAAGAEAIISVGAALTTVVVRERGVPQFMRVLNRGAEDVTAALAKDLAVEADVAEDLKRRSAGAGATATAVRARAVIADGLTPLIDEIRGSLDFYLAQTDAEYVDRVVITGGGVRTEGFPERLAHGIGHQVELADPLVWVKLGRTGLSREELEAAVPLMVTPIGLALGGAAGPLSGLRISLLPAEIIEARKQRQQLARAGLALGALAAVLGVGWAIHGQQVASVSHQASVAELRVTALQARVAAVNNLTGVKADLHQRQLAIAGALQSDVDWVRVLEQITAVMPGDVSLASFSGQVAPSGVGTVTFAASGANQLSVAQWLRQVATVPALTNLWVPNSTLAAAASTSGVTFSSTATITDGAYSDRAAKVLAAGVKR